MTMPPTMDMITFAIAEITVLMAEPIAEKIEPWKELEGGEDGNGEWD